MFRNWLVVTTLLISIGTLTVFIRQVIICSKNKPGDLLPRCSFVFLVKNQQNIIEGLIRKAFADVYAHFLEVIAVDFGSVDQTKLILERLTKEFPNFRFLASSEEQGISKRMYSLCHGDAIYCFDLRSSINYNLMARTIHSILHGSRASLYRTKIRQLNTSRKRLNR